MNDSIHPIRLSDLCAQIRQSIQSDFDDTYWVSAEISSLSARAGGHCYLELVEKSAAASSGRQSAADLAAKVRATCWANVWHVLSAFFQDATGMPLQVGMRVLVAVSVDYHPVYGLSLIISDIDPAFTLGDLMKQRRDTIARLQQEGMMDLQPALSLPALARRIAVISSSSAAGYQDFADQLKNSGFAFSTRLFPAIMQGEKAAASIMAALDAIFAMEQAFDLVVIIRGGGATTDLSCFDDYELCSYCAQFPLPVLSGIGHTRDVSILDMVCYHAVKTPTAAAEWLIYRMQEQVDRIESLALRLAQTAQRQVSLRSDRLSRLADKLRYSGARLLQQQRYRLDLWEKTIQLHSPEAIYRRGYALVLKDGKPVRSIADLSADDEILTCLADGTVLSRVINS